MALIARFLADTSALARLTNPVVERLLGPLIDGGLVATCAITDLEVLYSTRSGDEWEAVHAERRRGFERVPITEPVADRAIEVQGLLWTSGRVRAVGIADLLVAAAAEAAGLTVVHYDGDYDHIAAVTGQRCEWVVPAGTVD